MPLAPKRAAPRILLILWAILFFALTHRAIRLVIADRADVSAQKEALNDFATRLGPPEENAQLPLLNAHLAFKRLGVNPPQDEDWPDALDPWTEEDAEFARAVLRDAPDVLTHLKEAASCSFLFFEENPDGSLKAVELPVFDADEHAHEMIGKSYTKYEMVMSAYWHFRLALRLAAYERNWPRYLELVDLGLAISELTRESPQGMPVASFIVHAETICAQSKKCAASGILPSDVALSLIERLKTFGVLEGPSEIFLDYSATKSRIYLRETYSEDGVPVLRSPHLSRESPEIYHRLGALQGYDLPSLAAASRHLDRYLDRTRAWYAQSDQLFDESDEFFADLGDRTNHTSPVNDRQNRIYDRISPPPAGSTSKLKNPHAGIMLQVRRDLDTSIALTIAGLRIDLFRQQYNRLPETIEEAVPDDERFDPVGYTYFALDVSDDSVSGIVFSIWSTHPRREEGRWHRFAPYGDP